MNAVLKTPNELSIGDEFRMNGGPYGGRRVRVIATPTAGRYSVYDVPVELVDPVVVKLDFSEEVRVRNG